MLKKYCFLAGISLAIAGCTGANSPQATGDDVVQGLSGVGQATEDLADDVEAAFENGYNANGPLSPAEREHTREMAYLCNTSQQNIRNLRNEGLSWTAIAEKFGLASSTTGKAVWKDWQ